jgi:hypothetical protein
MNNNQVETKNFDLKESDLVKEVSISFIAILVLVILLSLFLKSPNVGPLSIRTYARNHPVGFTTTTLHDLMGTSLIATYGHPFNNNGSSQSIGPISPEAITGVTLPINTKSDFVLIPLKMESSINPNINLLLNEYNNATPKQQNIWEQNTLKSLPNTRYENGIVIFPDGNYGPVVQMLNELLKLGQSGLFSRALTRENIDNNGVYTYNEQNRLLFLQGGPLTAKAASLNMLGGEWGILKETGPYPGPWWLAFYTSLYQTPFYANSASADLMAFATFSLLIGVITFLPFLPGLRRIPYIIPVYKIIWRRFYNEQKRPKD